MTAADVVEMWRPWWQQKKAPATLRIYAQALRWCLSFLGVPPELTTSIPAVRFVQPRGVIARPEDIEKALAAATPPLRLYILLSSDIALRGGTALRLCENDWDHEAQAFRFQTKANVLVMLPPSQRLRQMIDLIHAYPCADKATPYIARLGASAPRKAKQNLAKQFSQLVKRLGLAHFTTHDLRRAAARRMYDVTGHDLRVVQSLLGHTNLGSTFRYLWPHQALVTAEQIESISSGLNSAASSRSNAESV